jgi:1,4-dihydroxy-2-naphthoyl-CoA hydrolase
MSRRLDRLAADFAAAPFARTLGLEVTAIGPERVTLRLPHRDENANRNGSLHGGVLASLVALGGTLVTRAGHAPEGGGETSTIDLAVQYLAPAMRESVTAEAVAVRRGREIVFVQVAIVSTTGTPIASGLAATRTIAPGRRTPASPREAAGADIPPEVLGRLRASGSPFSARLGVKSARLASGEAVAFLPDQPTIDDRDGRVAEGALATLADCAAGAAAWSVGGYDPRGRAATVSMHLTCGVVPRGEEVVAVARTAWRSAGLFVSAVTLGGRDSRRPIATGAVTYRIVRPGD